MFFRALKPKQKSRTRATNLSAVHGAVAFLPMKTGETDAVDGLAKPVRAQLLATALGDLVGYKFRKGRGEEPSGIELHFTLASAHPRTLKSVGDMLENFDAPVGSTIEFTETGHRHHFGRTEGLGVDIDADQNWLDYAEAAIETLAGDATYHGSRQLGSQRRLYFYGENASTMASRLRAAAQIDPDLPDGRTLRLT
ncbi:MAG: hypothetical protein AAFW64_04845 [Pseudomonadota bacterium]